MDINNKKIAVLFGGSSSEREVSILSGTAVLKAILDQGFDVFAWDPASDDITALRQANLAVISLHGRGGEDGAIQGLLEFLQIPYTGAKVLSSSLCMNKFLSKQIFKASGLPTANYLLATKKEDCILSESSLNFPIMVKAANEGSSVGAYKANNLEQLEQYFLEAHKLDNQVIFEQFITGDEFTVAILDINEAPLVFEPIKLVTDRDFYDYTAKYVGNHTQYLIPSGLDITNTNIIKNLALDAYRALNVKGWCRVDIMQDKYTGNFYLLEINTSPGMTDHSLVPIAAKYHGISFEQLVIYIAKTASL